MAKSPRVELTTRQAIDALGGAVEVAALFGFKSPNTVRNWYKRGFPPETALKLAPRLRKAVKVAYNEDELFQQYVPENGAKKK
mgnify:CR=1 FL=1